MKKLNNKGFSLVELMVVVAIIGVLAAVAIPSVNKYMAKARQAEAKSNLSAIYTGNKALFAEYGIYDNRFGMIAFAPEGKLRYNVGWSAAGTRCADMGGYPNTPTGIQAAIATSAYCGLNGTITNGCTLLADANQTTTGSGLNCTATPKTFTAAAAGRIGGTAVDIWTIDQNKIVRNPSIGLP